MEKTRILDAQPDSGVKLQGEKHSPIQIERTEFRNRLAAVLEDVKQGQDHIITRRNHQIALLSNTRGDDVRGITLVSRKQLKHALRRYLDEVEKGKTFEINNGYSVLEGTVFMYPIPKAVEPLLEPTTTSALSRAEKKRKYWREKAGGKLTEKQKRNDEKRALLQFFLTPKQLTNEHLQEAKVLLAAKRAHTVKDVIHLSTPEKVFRSPKEERKLKMKREKMRKHRLKQKDATEQKRSQARNRQKDAVHKRKKELISEFFGPDGMSAQDLQEALKLLAARWVREYNLGNTKNSARHRQISATIKLALRDLQ